VSVGETSCSIHLLLRDVSENRPLGDTTTLADPAVVQEIARRGKEEASREEQ
jgi:acetyl-CoA synthetase